MKKYLLTAFVLLASANTAMAQEVSPTDLSRYEQFEEGETIKTLTDLQEMENAYKALVANGNCEAALPAIIEFYEAANHVSNLISRGNEPYYDASRDERKSIYNPLLSELRSAENAFNNLRVQRDKAWVEEAKCLLSMGERNAAVTRLTRALDYISADERELWEEARTLLWAEVGFSPEDNVDKPSAQPLTGAERDALRVALQRCWNVGSLSSDALRTTIVVAFSLSEIGRPKTDSIRMVNFAGGSETAAKEAFERARRAIIRCGTNGFDLPIEKYDQWRNIEMTFIHERMAIR